MKKGVSILFLAILLVACGHSSNKKEDRVAQMSDSMEAPAPVDTLALTMDALRDRRLPDGYKMVGDLKTDILTYAGFEMSDAAYFIFKNSSGNTISFSGNDTNLELTVPKPDPKTESVLPSEVKIVETGGYVPNPKYLNKKFRVIWRSIQLNRKPQNETEFYYQEFDEVIYLKEE